MMTNHMHEHPIPQPHFACVAARASTRATLGSDGSGHLPREPSAPSHRIASHPLHALHQHELARDGAMGSTSLGRLSQG